VVSTLAETHAGEDFVGTARGISRINPGGQGDIRCRLAKARLDAWGEALRPWK